MDLPRARILQQAQCTCCPTCGSTINEKEFVVDLQNNVLIANGKIIKLTRRPAELIWYLRKNYPGTVPHEQIISKVWGSVETGATGLRTMVSLSRRYLELVGWTIKNEHGSGYKLVKQ